MVKNNYGNFSVNQNLNICGRVLCEIKSSELCYMYMQTKPMCYCLRFKGKYEVLIEKQNVEQYFEVL